MTLELIGELTFMDTHNIKPNFSGLSRKYGIDRHTIAKYWKNKGVTTAERNKNSYLDQYKNEIKQKMNDCNCSKMAIYQYFVSKYGSEIFRSYSTFCHYTHQCGFENKKDRAPHVRFETEPGKQLQVDWKESIKFRFKDDSVKEFNLFSATYGYSRFHYLIYSETKTTEDFLRCTIEVLRRSGGMPKEILTDNMSAVVSMQGNRKVKHPVIIQFEKDTGIEIRLCKVRSPETKGKVESSNRYVQWLDPYQGELENKSQLFEKIEELNRKINQEINQTTGIPPAVLMKKETEHLNPIKNKILLETYIRNTITQKVPATLLVRFQGKEYSVSPELIGEKVEIIPIENKLYIYHNTKLHCIHEISNQKINYDEDHYTSALSRVTKKTEDEIRAQAAANLALFGQLGGSKNE